MNMRKIQIMTDSASDISYADEQKYSISVIPFPITLGDKSYTSRVDFDNEQFFTLMAQHDEILKTAQITPFQFQQIYLREARAGVTDLILVLINSKGSSTYDNSLQAIDLFLRNTRSTRKLCIFTVSMVWDITPCMAVLWYMRRKCVITVLLWRKFFSI